MKTYLSRLWLKLHPKKSRLAAYAHLISQGLMAPNEARVAMGLPPRGATPTEIVRRPVEWWRLTEVVILSTFLAFCVVAMSVCASLHIHEPHPLRLLTASVSLLCACVVYSDLRRAAR